MIDLMKTEKNNVLVTYSMQKMSEIEEDGVTRVVPQTIQGYSFGRVDKLDQANVESLVVSIAKAFEIDAASIVINNIVRLDT